jgi:hypothetical protein
MIWDEYLPGIVVSGKSKFEDFSEDNVQAFYRLKLQSIEKQIREKLAPGSELRQLPEPDMSSVDQRIFSVQEQIAHLYTLSKPPPPINIKPLEEKIQEQADEISELKIALAAKTEDLNQLNSQVKQLIVQS